MARDHRAAKPHGGVTDAVDVESECLAMDPWLVWWSKLSPFNSWLHFLAGVSLHVVAVGRPGVNSVSSPLLVTVVSMRGSLGDGMPCLPASVM